MYPYHNKIKQRINNNELVSYEYVDSYNGISPALLLHFNTEPKIRPIREHRFDEYEKIFGQHQYKARFNALLYTVISFQLITNRFQFVIKLFNVFRFKAF